MSLKLRQLQEDQRHVAVVTGATGGLGEEFCKLAAADNMDVVLVARNQKKMHEVAQELQLQFGVQTYEIALDLSQNDACTQLIEQIDALGLNVDVLINNAGFGVGCEYVDDSWEHEKNLLEVNIVALSGLTHEFGRRMKAMRCGGILNVSSLAAFYPGVYMSTYYASKAYVHMFSDALHSELAPYGVTVTHVCPAPIRTPFFSNAGFGKRNIMNVAAYPAPFVAKFAYFGLRTGRFRVVPGILNKIAVLLSRVFPRCIKRLITKSIQYAPAHPSDKYPRS